MLCHTSGEERGGLLNATAMIDAFSETRAKASRSQRVCVALAAALTVSCGESDEGSSGFDYCHVYPNANAVERNPATTIERHVDFDLDVGSLLVARWNFVGVDAGAACEESDHFAPGCDDTSPPAPGDVRVDTTMEERDLAQGRKLFTDERWEQYRDVTEPITGDEPYWEVSYFFSGCDLTDNDRLKAPSDSQRQPMREMLDYLDGLHDKYLRTDAGVDIGSDPDGDAGTAPPAP